MKFTKMQGLGNDYIFVDCFRERVSDPAPLARLVSDRHRGIGGDGLILIRPSDVAHVRMEMYNADGSRGKMCGNGVRCLAKYVLEHGILGCRAPRDDAPSVTPVLAGGEVCEVGVETDGGVRRCQCHVINGQVDSVRVDMGEPILEGARIPTTLAAGRVVEHPLRAILGAPRPLTRGEPVRTAEFAVTCVSMGNPHAVIFVDDLHTIDLAAWGPVIEQAARFPERINVHFVRVDTSQHLSVRTWERGSGATLACGTGACAACVAGVLTGRAQSRVTVSLPGGDLLVEWAGHHTILRRLDSDEATLDAPHRGRRSDGEPEGSAFAGRAAAPAGASSLLPDMATGGDAPGRVYMTGPAVEVFTGEWPHAS